MIRTLSLLLLAAALVVTACSRSPQSTGIEYAAQMYHSAPLEPYSQMAYNEYFPNDKKNAREPVAGTVARGKLAYYFPYENTQEEYDRAGNELRNPIPLTQANFDEGKRQYAVYCSHCHGKDGKGDGAVPKKDSYPAVPPAYTSDRVKNLKEGQIFFSIFHGKGSMGAHGSQISPDDIWKIVYYVRKQRGEDLKFTDAPASATPADTTGGKQAQATTPATRNMAQN